MAADPNRDTFLKQLSEMRSLRSQQMQAGGQQMQALGRQTAMLSSMNSNLAKQSQQISQMNNSLSRGFSGLAKSVSGLSSAVTRGAASTVAAVSKGAGGAVGSAAAGAGRVSASAISGVTSGIVSALSYALPTAIAGVIGKSLIWDNIDEDTKKEMGENIGGIFKNVFGDSLKPVTKELKVMTLTLADTLESLSDRIGAVVSGIKGKMPALKDGARETASNISNRASDAAQEAAQKLPRGVQVAGLMARDVKDVAVKGYDLLKGTEAPEVEQVKTGVAVAGTAAAAYQTRKLAKESIPLAKTAEKGAGFKGSLNQQAMDLLKKDGSKVTKLSLLTARMVVRITVAGGATAAKVLGAIVKFKLDRAAAIIGPIITLVGLWYVLDTIESMVADKTVTPEDGKELADFAKKQAAFASAGSFVVGGLAAAAGVAGGGFLSVPLGIAGSIGGGMLGNYVAEKTTKFSASLTAEIPEAKKEPGSNLTTQMINLKEKKAGKKSASVVSKPSAGATTSDKDAKGETGNSQKAMEFLMARGWTKEQAAGIVGNLQVESALKTTAFNPKEDAIGVAQWRGPRQQKFKEIFGKDVKDATFEEQLAFVDWELRNSHKKAGDLLQGAKTAEDAALIIDEYYEISKGTGRGKGGDAIKKRQQNALALMGGGAQSTMTAGGGEGGQTAGLQGDQVSAGQKPTAGMSVSQKMDYYRSQSDEDGAQASSTPKPNEQKKPGMFDSFKNAFSSDSFDKLTGDLQKGVEDLMSFDITSKKEAAAGASAPPASGGDTVVNVSGGGGSSPPAYNPVAPAASYQSQFTTLAGIQRTA